MMKLKDREQKTLLEYVETVVEPNLFPGPDDDQKMAERKRTTRNKIFGPDTIGAVTLEYSTLEILEERGISEKQWSEMPLMDRGKLVAFSHLKNKVEVVREYKRQIAEARKNASQAHQNVSKSKG